MKALPILLDADESEKTQKEQALVGARDQAEQRLGFGTESFSITKPEENRPLIETIG